MLGSKEGNIIPGFSIQTEFPIVGGVTYRDGILVDEKTISFGVGADVEYPATGFTPGITVLLSGAGGFGKSMFIQKYLVGPRTVLIGAGEDDANEDAGYIYCTSRRHMLLEMCKAWEQGKVPVVNSWSGLLFTTMFGMSTTKNGLSQGFLEFLGFMSSALTRAKMSLVVVINTHSAVDDADSLSAAFGKQTSFDSVTQGLANAIEGKVRTVLAFSQFNNFRPSHLKSRSQIVQLGSFVIKTPSRQSWTSVPAESESTGEKESGSNGNRVSTNREEIIRSRRSVFHLE